MKLLIRGVKRLHLSKYLEHFIITVTPVGATGAHVDGKVIYASHKETESFSGNTNSKGEMSPSHSWPIGGNSNLGIFHVNVHASAKGHKPASATTTFNV